MSAIRSLRRVSGMTQADLARSGGTSQPTISAYESGRKSPTLETVERLARSAGLRATVSFHPALTREERRSLALHRAIAERLQRDPLDTLRRARATLERMSTVACSSSQALREWGVLLDRPVPALVEVLTDPSPWARELRHVTPFAGVLSARERAEVLRDFAHEDGAEEGGA